MSAALLCFLLQQGSTAFRAKSHSCCPLPPPSMRLSPRHRSSAEAIPVTSTTGRDVYSAIRLHFCGCIHSQRQFYLQANVQQTNKQNLVPLPVMVLIFIRDGPSYFPKRHPQSHSHCPVGTLRAFAKNASLAHPACPLQGPSLYSSHEARLEERPHEAHASVSSW